VGAGSLVWIGRKPPNMRRKLVVVGSNPTPPAKAEPHTSNLTLSLDDGSLVNFSLYLLRQGNRESTIKRKLKFLRAVRKWLGVNCNVNRMVECVLKCGWCAKSKNYALITLQQFAAFKGYFIEKPKFKVYDNNVLFVPSPSMVRMLVYRIRSYKLKVAVMIAIETGASLSEVHGIKWSDINFQNRTLTIRGVKGHRSNTYPISNELLTLLTLIPKDSERIFKLKYPDKINAWLKQYVKRLAKETGNSDFLKIHFHTFRHFAISWRYFKTKDIVETQRFARHCNIQNTLRYVHIVKSWIKENEFNVVYAEDKAELTKYLAEGYELVTKTEWGYCLRKPKTIT